ncbi:MAG: PKD domain-containing protein [Thermoplasmatota archaeon]
MKRAGLLSVLIAIVFLLQAGALIGANMPEEDSAELRIEEGFEPAENDVILEVGEELRTGNEMIDFDDLVAKGYYTEKVLRMEDVMPKPHYFPGEYGGALVYDPIYEKDQNDAFTNATELNDGDHIYNNITSYHTTSGGNTYVHFNDVDYYYINLTADPDNNLADRLNITITCTDAVNKSAFLGTEFGTFFLTTLFGGNAGFDTMDFELTGAMQGKTSYIDVIVEATGSYYFWVDTWNNTKLNYTLDVDVTQTTVTEWNGLWFPTGGTPLDSTNRNVRMATIDQAHDTYDWYNLNGMIEETGLDQDRGDHLRLSFQVDIATEFHGAQWGYKGPVFHGLQFPTTPITNLFFVYNNYSEFNQGQPSLHLYLPDGQNIPYASQVFGTGGRANDPVTLGLTSAEQIDMAWIGLAAQQLWFVVDQNGNLVFYDFGCDYGARVAYNLTTWNIKLIPPNDPPEFDKTIPDIMYSEDEGPWLEVIDLEDHFSDTESQGYLRYVVEDVGTNPSKLQLSVEDGKLNIATDENFFGQGTYRIRCYDNGSDLEPDSADDRWVLSNNFDVTILSVNDPAYIEKVDTPVSTKINDHTPIPFNLAQGDKLIGRKVYGMDNDTEDKGSLVYTHNATTPAFSINDIGQFNFIPSNSDVGETWIKVWIDDGHSPDEDDYCILWFNVSNRNDKPELLSIEWRDKGTTYDLTEDSSVVFRGVEEDMELNLTITASDPDLEIGADESLTWILGSAGWEAHPHQTQPHKAYITYTPSNNDAIIGEAATTLQVVDSKNAESSEISITIQVDNRNDPPEILFVNDEPVIENKVVLDQTTNAYGFEDEPYILTIVADDIDPKDSLTFTASDTSFIQTADLIDEFKRNFTIIPDQDRVGTHTILITATDKKGAKDSVQITYEIVNTNDIPNKPKLKMDEITPRLTGNSLEFWVIDEGDPDGDEVTFHWEFGDGSPIITGSSVNHTFKRDGIFKITVTAKDGNGGEISVSDSITIALKPVVIDPDLDTDGDGIPDWWEDQFNGLDKNNNDSGRDHDGDDFTNLEEYLGADGIPPSGPDDPNDDSTSPIDINSHPPVDEGGKSDNTIFIVIIVFAVLFFLIIIGFLLVMLMRNPKQVAAPQMYAPEAGALPPGQPPGLPGPQPQQLPQAPAQQLPPAPQEPEEDLLASFMEEAHKEVVAAEDHGQEDDVWRPPAEPEETDDSSQVDDLFSESEDSGEPEQEPPEREDEPAEADSRVPAPPAPPKLPDLPPLPKKK